MSVRELVKAAQVELRDGEVLPARARQLLVSLSSLLGNCNEEIRAADAAYAAVLLAELDAGGKANRAKIAAECSPEYARKQEAKNTHALVVEMIRSLKYLMRSVEEEMRLAR